MSTIFEEFRSLKCLCGARKCASRAFCTDCYFSLPVEIRSELWRSFGEEYEQAYQSARSFLLERLPESRP